MTDPLETRIAAVLAAHDDPTGWTWTEEDVLVYECMCGDQSPALSHNLIHEAAADWHRAHVAAEIARALGAETRVEWGFRHPGWPTIDIGPHVETSYTGHDGWTTGPYDAETARQFANGRPVVIRTVTTIPPLVGDWQEADS